MLFHPMGNASVSRPHTIEGVQFVLVPTAQVLSKIRNHAQYGLDTDPPTYVISGLLDLDVDTSTLSTSLIGREDYVTALIPDDSPVTTFTFRRSSRPDIVVSGTD